MSWNQDLIQRKENELQKAIQKWEASEKMIGQLKGEIAKYKEV
jgi:ribosome-interacting GTPase 1